MAHSGSEHWAKPLKRSEKARLRKLLKRIGGEENAKEKK